MSVDAAIVSDAIVLWTGWHSTPMPQRDDKRVIQRYGEGQARELISEIHRLDAFFYASNANLIARDLREMAALASSDFSCVHPEISPDAVAALAWCYVYDYK